MVIALHQNLLTQPNWFYSAHLHLTRCSQACHMYWWVTGLFFISVPFQSKLGSNFESPVLYPIPPNHQNWPHTWSELLKPEHCLSGCPDAPMAEEENMKQFPRLCWHHKTYLSGDIMSCLGNSTSSCLAWLMCKLWLIVGMFDMSVLHEVAW